jgi:leader peptidase (prepilin peptidase)/N-methyltransferase
MEYILVFIIGLCIGSFLNVCVYRIPKAKSIVRPRSLCPDCGKSIKWYDNIPLASFAILRGRCRNCGKKIPLRYPLGELLTALVSVLLYWYFGPTGAFAAYWVLACALIVIALIDLETQEVPDVISIPGIAVGVILMSVFRLDGASNAGWAFLDSIAGILIGGLMVFLMGVAGEIAFRKEAVGGGDVKLMAMIGAFLGWRLCVLAFFIAPLTGVGVAVFMKIKYKTEAIPYAPYLALGAMVSLLWGNRIIEILFGMS